MCGQSAFHNQKETVLSIHAPGAVIEFPLDRVRPAKGREQGAPPAEVLIFTGVRIERLGEEVSSMPLPRPGAGARPVGRRRRR